MLRLVKKFLGPFAHKLVVKISRTRVSGENLKDARAVGDYFLNRGYWVTLAYWNQDDEPPAAVVSRYEEAITALGAVPRQEYLSIKAPAFDFDPGLYRTLLTKARKLGVPLHFDSLEHEAADRTFSLITEQTPPLRKDIGCTLPGRWKRSLADAEKMADLGLAIRVVKGEWPDPDHPDADLRKGFLAVIAKLAGRARLVRIATHDCDLVRESVRILHRAGTACDLELLYGFPVRHLWPRVKEIDVPIRLYVPYGHGWIPYCWKQSRKHPGFLWWLLKDSLSGSYQEGFPVRRVHRRPPSTGVRSRTPVSR